MAAPGCRGEERHVATTVPIATGSPSRHHASSSPRTSRTLDHLRELVGGVQRVPGDEAVAVRQHGTYPCLDRRVPVLAGMGVGPDDAVGERAQPTHLAREEVDPGALPAVARDDDDRPTGGPALSPPVEEGLERLTDPGATGP